MQSHACHNCRRNRETSDADDLPHVHGAGVQADQDVVGQGDGVLGPRTGQEQSSSSESPVDSRAPRGCDNKLFEKIFLLSFIMRCQLFVHYILHRLCNNYGQ